MLRLLNQFGGRNREQAIKRVVSELIGHIEDKQDLGQEAISIAKASDVAAVIVGLDI